jgi:hypothetical protein
MSQDRILELCEEGLRLSKETREKLARLDRASSGLAPMERRVESNENNTHVL